MYEVVVETSFTAAHTHAGGLHGHDFRVLIGVESASLADDFVVDFHALKLVADAQLARIAYRELEGSSELEGLGVGPAAIARWLFEWLEAELPALAGAPDKRLSHVEVWDTPGSGARYSQ